MNKVIGEDQISPKLNKTAGNFFVEPLTDIINSCFNTSTSPHLEKAAQLHLLTRVVLTSILTQTTDLLVF